MSEIAKIYFLWNASSTWSPKTRVGNILKSYYLTICRKTAKSDEKLPQSQFSERAMCSKCSSCWYDGNFTVKTIPKQLKGSKGKKLVEAYKAGKDLTKNQKQRAKWYMKKSERYLEITCKVCEHKTKIILKKPAKSEIMEETRQNVATVETKSKKKKKKKDKFSGLTLESAITPKAREKIPTSLGANESKKKKKLLPQSTNIKKAKTKTAPQGKPQQSKTQQKNALLQLAQMLKKNGSSNQNTSTNDRLKNLLR